MALEALLMGIELKTLNFGPDTASLEVQVVVNASFEFFPEIKVQISQSAAKSFSVESKVLGLNPDLAQSQLNWQPRWSQIEAIRLTFIWWKDCLNSSESIVKFCVRDIMEYFSNRGKE
jgi:hypothetical protein